MDGAVGRASLASLRPGAGGMIAAVQAEYEALLAREGIRVGVEIGIEAVAPFGGPVILGVGRARVAIAGRIAGAIEVVPLRRPHPR